MTDPADKDSILTSTKLKLGIMKEYTVFDTQLIIDINSVISTLHQLGLGTDDEEFEVEDETQVWDDLFGTQKNLNFVKSYVYLRVRQLFDPPATGFTSQAFDNQIKEFEWRISVACSSTPNIATPIV